MEQKSLFQQLRERADEYNQNPDYNIIQIIKTKAMKQAEHGKYELEYYLPFSTNGTKIRNYFLTEGLRAELKLADDSYPTLILKW